MPDSPAYTHGHHETVLRSHQWRTAENSAAYLLPYVRAGQQLLDVGCGIGTITMDLAALVAPGTLTAVEQTDAALELARDEGRRRGVTNVDFLAADAHELPFEDDSFDVVHAHQVLQHLPDPVRALREMRRVCRPAGIVAVRDSDYAAFAWYPTSAGLDDWLRLYGEAARANGGEPDAGRRLLAWAHEAGFSDVTPGSSTWCLATPEDRGWWGGSWSDRILESAIAEQLLREHRATRADLERISAAWSTWAAEPDGWFSLLHGELIARP